MSTLKIDKFVRKSLVKYVTENGVINVIMEYIDYEEEFKEKIDMIRKVETSLYKGHRVIMYVPCFDELNELYKYVSNGSPSELYLTCNLSQMLNDFYICGFEEYFIDNYSDLIVKYDKYIYLSDNVKIIDIQKIQKKYMTSVAELMFDNSFLTKFTEIKNIDRFLNKWRDGYIFREYSNTYEYVEDVSDIISEWESENGYT